jgi:ABC-type transport system involved in multi-copper enzyme maturation permease subunit
MLAAIIGFVLSFTIMFGFGDAAAANFLPHTLSVFGLQFLYYLPYAAVACFLSFVISSNVLGVAVGVVYVISQGILINIFLMLDSLNFFAKLMPFYYVDTMQANMDSSAFLLQGAAVSIGYVVILTLIGCFVFQRKDIK